MTATLTAIDGPALLGGRYALGAPVAIGGGATVLHAIDLRLGRAVAVKRANNAAGYARLRAEAVVLARCAHPGVVAFLDAGDDDEGVPYVVLALVEGVNLVQHVAADRPQRAVACTWAREASRALAYLHAHGVAHGDLKPQHLVVGGDGRAVLVDFDHARAATPSEVARDRRMLAGIARWLLAQSQTGRA